ncbi:UNVERIFIED_CONTAM: hypothetical protein FKN15_018859 [Acipenser sinensis]
MGNTASCCVSSSPKLRRNTHSRLESYRPEPELSREDTGCNLQHISDRENLDDTHQTKMLWFPANVKPRPQLQTFPMEGESRLESCACKSHSSRINLTMVSEMASYIASYQGSCAIDTNV